MAGIQMRVLIVDDNVDLAENIAEILQIDGHLTDIAASAEEALPLAVRTAPDVLITDYRLPGVNGAYFVKQFRDTRAHFQALVISAYTDEGTRREASEAGAMFFAKPLDLPLLCRVVRDGTA